MSAHHGTTLGERFLRSRSARAAASTACVTMALSFLRLTEYLEWQRPLGVRFGLHDRVRCTAAFPSKPDIAIDSWDVVLGVIRVDPVANSSMSAMPPKAEVISRNAIGHEEFKVKPSNLFQEQRRISTSASQTSGVSFWALLVGHG